jgi:hypothetical protein
MTFQSETSSFEQRDFVREPNFQSPRATPSHRVRVAPPPVSLVQKPVISSRVPTPLIDSSSSPQSEPEDMGEKTRAESDLGRAGALFDTERNKSDSTISSPSDGVLFDRAATAETTTTPIQGSSLHTSSYAPGTKIKATLLVGIIAVQGQESPVALRLERGEIGFGKASLNSSGRVNIELLEITGHSSPINASALGVDGFPGVPATLLEDSPDVVSQLWQAGLKGVSSYAQSAIEGATTTVTGGATSITTPQPNLALSLLQGLAQTFLAPPNQNAVKYAKLEPNTVLEFLVMPGR